MEEEVLGFFVCFLLLFCYCLQFSNSTNVDNRPVKGAINLKAKLNEV